MKITFRILAMLICFALVLSACGGNGDESQPGSTASQPGGSDVSGAPGGTEHETVGPTGEAIGGGFSDKVATKSDPDTFTMVTGQDSGNLDPQNNQLIVGIMVEKQIFDTLIMKDDVSGELVPGLALEWEWLDDTHLKCTLREGVKFHNGEDFTSEDVLKTVEKFATGSATAALYKAFSLDESEAVSDYEVIIGFSQPFAPALNYLAHTRAAIVPADYLAENGNEALFQNPVGTGAYKLVKWNVGSDTTLERNDDWWGKGTYGDCHFKNIKIIHTAESGSRAISLEAGEVDLAIALEEADFTNIFNGNVPNLLATKTTGVQVNHISFNWNFEAFNDVRVRQALAYAVDWATAVEAAGGQTLTQADSCVASTVAYYKSIGTYEYDPERSKELLADAGYENLSFDATILEGSYYVRIMEIIQAYWADVGVTMNINVTDSATWVEAFTNGTNDLSLMNMTAMTMDPAHTLMQVVGDATNITGRIPDEQFNEYVNTGLAELDETKRAEIYANLQQHVFDQVLQIPMFVPNQTYGYWDYLDGVIPDPGQQLDMRRIGLKTN